MALVATGLLFLLLLLTQIGTYYKLLTIISAILVELPNKLVSTWLPIL